MAPADPKTTENDGDVAAFVASVDDETRRRDALVLLELMERVTGEPARMWGPSIIGFGRHHYAYPSEREGDQPAAAFAPRKAATTVYLMGGADEGGELLGRLGPHTLGKGCLYLKRLDAVDLEALEELVRRSYQHTTTRTRPAG